MANLKTKIEWTDATWSPVTGCSKVSPGCKHCYAETVAHRFWKDRPFTDVRCHPERLDAPLHWKKPRRIFVNSMSDLFHEDVPDDFILRVFDVMRQCELGWTRRLGGSNGKLVSGHTFQILTKRPQRMLDFCARLRFETDAGLGLHLAESLSHRGFNPMKALRRVWLGVSVEDQTTADERIPLLLRTPAAVRFLSCEPMIGPLRIDDIDGENGAILKPLVGLRWIPTERGIELSPKARGPKISWVIAGGESGPHARPMHPDWARALRDQCAAAGVPFFFKQWGEHVPGELLNDGRLEPWRRYQNGRELWSIDEHVTQSFPREPVRWIKAGKKAAGRLLDGRLHDEYPA